MSVVKEDCSPTLLLNAAKAHGLIVCRKKSRVNVRSFAQNTRNEVRFIGENGEGNVSGALAAEPGSHQTTFLLIRRSKK